ncbi:hypothetical protein OAB01_03070, partial [Bacteroidia bacterium]|nr:hypothetical protein [Bacteroidia bacterium]
MVIIITKGYKGRCKRSPYQKTRLLPKLMYVQMNSEIASQMRKGQDIWLRIILITNRKELNTREMKTSK